MSALFAGKMHRLLRTVVIAVGLAPTLPSAVTAADPWLHLSIAPARQPEPPTSAAAWSPASFHLPPPADDAPAGDAELSFLTTQSVACLITGGTATVAAVAFGWQNVTNLISGGVVPAAGPGAVALGLFGVVFTSFCAIGQALTPLYLDFVNGELSPARAAPGPPPRPPEVEQMVRPSVIRAGVLSAERRDSRFLSDCLSINAQVPIAAAC